jgi:hypothetical protein
MDGNALIAESATDGWAVNMKVSKFTFRHFDGHAQPHWQADAFVGY